jgi:hypothetical protein
VTPFLKIRFVSTDSAYGSVYCDKTVICSFITINYGYNRAFAEEASQLDLMRLILFAWGRFQVIVLHMGMADCRRNKVYP